MWWFLLRLMVSYVLVMMMMMMMTTIGRTRCPLFWEWRSPRGLRSMAAAVASTLLGLDLRRDDIMHVESRESYISQVGIWLGGGNLDIFGIFTLKIGEDSQFDWYFSNWVETTKQMMSCALKPATLETLTLSSCQLPRSLGKKQKFLNGAKSLESISNQKGRKGLRSESWTKLYTVRYMSPLPWWLLFSSLSSSVLSSSQSYHQIQSNHIISPSNPD